MNYMFLPLKRYADFQGRSRRLEYWLFALLNAIVLGVLYGIIIGSLAGSVTIDPNTGAATGMNPAGAGFGGIVGIILFVWSLAVLVPLLAVTVRRLHDQDKSGWLVLLQLVPIANIVLLVFMFLPGTPGPNKFGPDPKGGIGAAETFR